jgi:hypothetical protein
MLRFHVCACYIMLHSKVIQRTERLHSTQGHGKKNNLALKKNRISHLKKKQNLALQKKTESRTSKKQNLALQKNRISHFKKNRISHFKKTESRTSRKTESRT